MCQNLGNSVVAVHLALCWLFVGLFRGLTVPQAQFAFFTQGITSFDLGAVPLNSPLFIKFKQVRKLAREQAVEISEK